MLINSRSQIGDLIKELALYGNIAEVGVAEGLFSKCIIENFPYENLYLVDLWDKQEDVTGDGNFPKEWHSNNFSNVKNIIKDKSNIFILRGYSHQMANEVEDNSFSLIYIDADHSYEGVRKDIVAWLPKLMVGGIMAFHDYLNIDYEVKKAVEELCSNYNIIIIPENGESDAGAYFIKL